MLIRRFQSADAPALWSVFYSAIHELACADYSPEQLEAWAPREPDADKWAARMEGIQPWVAEIDGRIAGYADLQADGYIDHFFVAAAAARRGVGTALMRRIHDTASQRGIRRLYCDVSITARPFFGRFGFQVQAAQQVSVRNVVLDNLRMQKELPAAPQLEANQSARVADNRE